MKTAISIESDLLIQADVAAQQMGLSRSRLIAIAVEQFLRHRRNEEVLAQLDRAYATVPDTAEKTLVRALKSKARVVIRDAW